MEASDILKASIFLVDVWNMLRALRSQASGHRLCHSGEEHFDQALLREPLRAEVHSDHWHRLRGETRAGLGP